MDAPVLFGRDNLGPIRQQRQRISCTLRSVDAEVQMRHKSEQIRQAIIRDLNRGVTVYKGRGGLSGAEQEILYCVVTRLEIGSVKNVSRLER